MDLAIDSRWIYYPHRGQLLKNGRIIIEDDRIIFSGNIDDLSAQIAGHDHYAYEKGLIIPGFINAHTHLPETLLRGLCDDKDLQSWLYDVIWKVEPNLKGEDAYYGTLLGIADMLSSGTTGFNDQYFYSNKMSEAVEKTGIKAILCPSIFYEGNPESKSMEEALSYAIKTYKKWNGHNKRLWIGLGPHAPYTVGKEWFIRIAETAEELNTTLHTHLNETQYEVNQALKEWNMRPIEWMDHIGVLKTIGSAAHCIYLSDNEIDLLKHNNVSVLHCPKSNLKIGAGIANVPKLHENKINVCLGTDGQASNNKLDMIEEIAIEVLLHKGFQKNPLLVPSAEAVMMATFNGRKLFPSNTYSGTLLPQTRADLVVVDLNQINTTPVINSISHLTYAMSRQNISLTIVDGNILYNNGEFSSLNVEEVMIKCQKITNRLMEEAYGVDWEEKRC